MHSVPPHSPQGRFSTKDFAYSNNFWNDGGRLVVMPRSLLGAWHGSIFPWTESLRGRWGWRIADFFEDHLMSFTDFKRAHRAREWFDVIRVGRGQAIVIGKGYWEVYARWLRTLPEAQDYLVAKTMIDPGAGSAIADFVRNLPEAAWRDLGLRIQIPDEELMLFALEGV